MRSLAQPDVLKAAAVAAILTSAACIPRLVLWSAMPYPLWFACSVLLWAAFVLWSFVFAWHESHADRPVFTMNIRPALWAAATVCGICGALALRLFFDPVLRPLAPGDYPATLQSWCAMTLFVMALDQLFLCFAPFAFFVRLCRHPKVAAGLTVMFAAFLLFLKLKSSSGQYPALFVAELFAWRIAAGSLSVYFYLRGGALLTWWWVLLLQTRHLSDLLIGTAS